MGFFLHACMCTACMQYPLRPEEAGRPLGTGASAGWAPPGNPTWALCKVASAFKHRAISPVLGTYFPPPLPPPTNFLLICEYICVNFLTFLCLSFSTSKVVGRFSKVDSELGVHSAPPWKLKGGVPCSERLWRCARVGVWSRLCLAHVALNTKRVRERWV